MPNLRDSWAVAVVCRLCRAQCRGVKTKDHKLRVSSAKTMAESQGWGRWKHGSLDLPRVREGRLSRVAKAVVATKSPEGAARKLERPLSLDQPSSTDRLMARELELSFAGLHVVDAHRLPHSWVVVLLEDEDGREAGSLGAAGVLVRGGTSGDGSLRSTLPATHLRHEPSSPHEPTSSPTRSSNASARPR